VRLNRTSGEATVEEETGVACRDAKIVPGRCDSCLAQLNSRNTIGLHCTIDSLLDVRRRSLPRMHAAIARSCDTPRRGPGVLRPEPEMTLHSHEKGARVTALDRKITGDSRHPRSRAATNTKPPMVHWEQTGDLHHGADSAILVWATYPMLHADWRKGQHVGTTISRCVHAD
jgi:hypothetical protein